MNDMIDSCTWAVSAASALPIEGKVGRYMSMANGPITESNPRITAARKILLSI